MYRGEAGGGQLVPHGGHRCLLLPEKELVLLGPVACLGSLRLGRFQHRLRLAQLRLRQSIVQLHEHLPGLYLRIVFDAHGDHASRDGGEQRDHAATDIGSAQADDRRSAGESWACDIGGGGTPSRTHRARDQERAQGQENGAQGGAEAEPPPGAARFARPGATLRSLRARRHAHHVAGFWRSCDFHGNPPKLNVRDRQRNRRPDV